MIIVKSIKEKPKECRGCKFLCEVTYDCAINPESLEYTTCEEQYEHCPIEELPDINVGNMDITTHESIPAENGINDGDRTSGDCISRQQAIDAVSNCGICIQRIVDLPSAQPEETALHESCTNCPLYDKDRHNCPRFNKVIPEALRELQSAQPERKDAIEKAVAVEAISDELMSRFDISATYAYEVAESAVNRIEVMAKELERGEDG